MKSIERLNDVTIRELWNSPQEVAGSDIVSESKHILRINKGIDLRVDLNPQTRFVVVVAWLRSPTKQQFWNAVRLPLGYQIGACKSDLDKLPPPCAFASVGKSSVSMGLDPQIGFNTRGIEATCPSTLLLHSFSERSS